MAFPARGRRSVAFGYAFFFEPQEQPAARQKENLATWRLDRFRADSQQTARAERFMLSSMNTSALAACPAANTHNSEWAMPLDARIEECKVGGATGDQPLCPPMSALAAVSRRGAPRGSDKADTLSGVSLTVGAVSSFSVKGSARSSRSSECSSLAPYWVPEEVKHYFRHRHPATDDGEVSSQKTDAALREIGRERELPAADDSHWSG
ncbi:uncharacterized protein LOC125942873 [Dermacentor silvarum]|uniref:uncharacterized protein LOC125942873 n=1 Tax=Dermacentor silvarum TaxID=543639 RepID=UPI002100DE96|nr:uncharacterized protein LOC125942873 [Dermacentor silvarum]